MRKGILTALAVLVCTAASAQIHTTKPSISYTLTDDLSWIMRYEKSIQAFRDSDKDVTDFTCDGLFVGSSSIMHWKTLDEDFPGMKMVNRGYGGSTIRDILYNYASVFGRYQPRNIVFYCDNDVSGDPRYDVSAGEWYDLYRTIFQKMHADYPDAQIYALCIKYSDDRLSIRHIEKFMNYLMEEFCKQNDWMTYVDVNTPILLPDGTPDPKFFREDKLHVNRDAYAIWAKELIKAGLK